MEPECRTQGDADSRWSIAIREIQLSIVVEVDGSNVVNNRCPPRDSLERRFASSDQQWLSSWMEEDDDPTRP